MEEITSLWTSKAFVLQANSRSVRNLRRRRRAGGGEEEESRRRRTHMRQ